MSDHTDDHKTQPEGDQGGGCGSSKEILIPQPPPYSPYDCGPTDGPDFVNFSDAAMRPGGRITSLVGLSTALVDEFGKVQRRENLGKPHQGPKAMSEAGLLLSGMRACLHRDAMMAAWCSVLLSLRYNGAARRDFPGSEPFLNDERQPEMRWHDEHIIEVPLADGSPYPLEPCGFPASCISPSDSSAHTLAELLKPDRVAFIDAMRRNALYGGT